MTHQSIRWTLGIALCIVLPVRAQAQPPTLETRWTDLNSSDEGKATRALLGLAGSPKETIAFFQDHLKPVKADPKRVAQLLKALDSNTFAIRQQALLELEYYGKYIKADLETAHKAAANPSTKRSVEQLLDKLPQPPKKVEPPMPLKGRPGGSISVSNINGQIQIMIDGKPLDLTPPAPLPPPPGPPLGWTRAVRAVTLLEHLATPEAQAMLQSMAAGESDALPTIAAREALDRLKKQ